MPSFTVQNIVDRAASIADIHDQFVTVPEWLAWFNFERRALTFLMARYGSAAVNVTFTRKVTDGSNFLLDNHQTIPTDLTDILAIVGIWELKADQRLRPLKIVPYVDNMFQLPDAFSASFSTFVSPVVGPANIAMVSRTDQGDDVVITLYPTPPAGANYVVGSVRMPQTAVLLASVTSVPAGLEEWIVLRLARRALIKEESDTKAIEKLIDEVESQVEEYCSNLTIAQGNKVRNVDNFQRGWWDDLGSVHPEMWLWL